MKEALSEHLRSLFGNGLAYSLLDSSVYVPGAGSHEAGLCP